MSFDMSLARGLDYYTGIIYEAIHDASAPPSKSPTPAVPAPSSIQSDANADSSSSTPAAPAPRSKKPKAPSAAQASSSGSGGNPTTNEDGIDESAIGVGSIAAGGRYDNLVNMFAEASGASKRDLVPCVGVSVGVERVYSIMEMRRRGREEKVRGKETEVFVLSLGGGLLKERMSFAKKLRDAGIKVSTRLLALVQLRFL